VEPARPAVDPATLTGPRVLWTYRLNSFSFGGAAIADTNGDGINDIAFGTYFGDATVRVLSGKDGRQLWAYHDLDPNHDDCYDASCRFADLKGDGKLELIVPCSSGCKVLCFDAADGRVLWQTDVGLKQGECIDTPPAIVDADGDGKLDITVGTFAGKLHVLRADGTESRVLKVAPGAVQSCPMILDLDNDGVVDFVAGNFHGDNALHAVSGKDGRELWRVKTDPGRGMGDIYHGPALGTVRVHGKPRRAMTFAAYDGHVRAVDPESGQAFWDVQPGDRYFMSPTVMLDLDGAGCDTTIAACEWITAINADGSVRWHLPVTSSKVYDSVTRGVAVADLNGDGHPDLAYLTGGGLFRVLDARDGHMIYEYYASSINADGLKTGDCSHCPVIADLGGDGYLDVFFVVGGPPPDARSSRGEKVTRYGTAVCLTGFPGKASPTNSWLMFRHDPRNTGNPATPLDPSLARHIR
jgi:outer membrane protein assembly factor BamB